ncbi:MAG: HD domain-containing protein [Acidobacteriota bacterium]
MPEPPASISIACTEPFRIDVPDPQHRAALTQLVADVAAAGGRALVVGGSVRDALRGDPAKDLDVEVYGLAPDMLEQTLAGRFPLDRVGVSFGVLKLKGLPIDVSLPRRESKRGRGHRGFEIDADPALDLVTASARRDFTINAMAWDPARDALLDPHGGLRDLERGVLRHVSPAFVEDPLRVLRAMQFVARFDLAIAPETVALCRTIEAEDLAPERVFDEWRKLILRGRAVSRGLNVLRDTGWLARDYPELAALIDCPQDPRWHPEGDVWTHTGHVLDAFAARRIGDDAEDLVVGLACLCHDIGKPAATEIDADGAVRSPGHEALGEAPTRALLGRMTRQAKLIDEVVALVLDHMKPFQLYDAGASAAAVRRLARRVGRIDRLVRVNEADARGRPPLPADDEPGRWLLAQADALALADAAPQPLVLGRHLIALGLAPGPQFGPILAEVFDAQLDGIFDDVDAGVAHACALLAARGVLPTG